MAKSNRDHSSGQGEGKDRGDYVQQVKEALVISYISFAANPVEKFLRKQGVNSLFLEMLADPKLDKDQAGEITDEAVAQARSELRAFIPEELENQLIKATLTQSEKFDDVVKLLKVAKQADFDAEKWINEVWPGRKEHQGLYVMDVPAEAVGLNVNVKNDQTDARNDRGKYEYKVEDEQDLALNRLRSLYMQMALGSQLTNRVATFFKMRKLKNGLIKLGVFTDQVDEKLQREGRALAKMKTIEMLEEGLHEEATFFDQGTAQSLVERKVKNCLKNLEKLGVTLSESEFGSLKSKAQKKILEIAKHELEVVRAQADSQLLGQREDMLVKLVTRLETDLGEPGMVSRLEISA